MPFCIFAWIHTLSTTSPPGQSTHYLQQPLFTSCFLFYFFHWQYFNTISPRLGTFKPGWFLPASIYPFIARHNFCFLHSHNDRHGYPRRRSGFTLSSVLCSKSTRFTPLAAVIIIIPYTNTFIRACGMLGNLIMTFMFRITDETITLLRVYVYKWYMMTNSIAVCCE